MRMDILNAVPVIELALINDPILMILVDAVATVLAVTLRGDVNGSKTIT